MDGTSGEIGRLLYAIGEGAPPIILQELTLSAEKAIGGRLSCTANLEIERHSLPEEWIALLTELVTESGDQQDIQSASSPGRMANRTAAFPYKAIDRPDVFQANRRVQSSKRLETAGTTIRNLTKNLSFRGVIGNEEPEAIIFDKNSGNTHYRVVGQFIGELEIIEITRNSVTLKYKDEEERLE